MPFRPHYRISAIGRLGSSGERFQYGLNMAPQGGAGTAGGTGDTITFNDDAWRDTANDVRSFHARAATQISNQAVLEVVKVARIGADGKYETDPLIFDIVDAPGGGGNTGYTVPQTALAISLVTERRGPSGKGRFYIPMPALAIPAGTLTVQGADASAVRDSAAQLLNAMNNAPGLDASDLKVCVASTKGFNSPVTGVRVGLVVDTIRSRRAALPENYTVPAAVA